MELVPDVAAAIGSLWYLTVGTIASIAVTILLFVPAVRDLYRS